MEVALDESGVQEIGGNLVVYEVCGDDLSQRLLARLACRVVGDLQLGAKLGGGATGIDIAKHLLPESSPHRQERVVGSVPLFVRSCRCDPRIVQVTVDLAGVGFERFGDGFHLLGLLGQHRLADDILDIRVGERHLDGEARLEAAQTRGSRKGGLSGAHQQQPAVHILAASLGDLLDIHGPLDLVADVLLHFVHDDQGARQFVLLAEDLADDLERLFNGGGCTRWELMADGRLGILRIAETLVDRHQCLGEQRRDIEVANLPVGVVLLRLQVGRHFVEQFLLAQPQDKSGGCEILRQVNGTKDQLQESEARVLHIACAQRARSGPQPAEALRAVGEFDEQFLDLARKVSNRASRRAIGESVVHPEVAQHLDEMGFAGAKEAADPRRLLLGFAKSVEVGGENPLQAFPVFAVTNEGLQLETERLQLLLVLADLGDLRYAVVDEFKRKRILQKDFSVLHILIISPQVIGTAM